MSFYAESYIILITEVEFMKTALITGASSGIGREFARQYAARGYRLILSARRKDVLEELSRELDTECIIMTADLSDEAQCLKLLEDLREEKIDVLINNAGFGLAGDFLHNDLQRELSMIKVNDIALHILLKGILQKMNEKGEGTIVNVCSSAGLIPGGPYMATYYASKSYAVSLTRAVVQELKEAGSSVYVCALCPGPVDTDFNHNAGVTFSLKGITPEQCVSECMKEMDKGKTIIVPSTVMKLAVFFSRFVPLSSLVKITGHQQKKKTGKI